MYNCVVEWKPCPSLIGPPVQFQSTSVQVWLLDWPILGRSNSLSCSKVFKSVGLSTDYTVPVLSPVGSVDVDGPPVIFFYVEKLFELASCSVC